MSKVLVKQNSNWADEFDTQGFIVLDKDAWEKRKEKNKKVFEEEGYQECYFGTNEAIDYEDYNHWISDIQEIDITDDQAKLITTQFGNEYGIFVEPYYE